MYLIDFGFEREVPEFGNEKVLRSGIKVGNDDPHPAKKSKSDREFGNSDANAGVKDNNSDLTKFNSEKSAGKQKVYWSAPPK